MYLGHAERALVRDEGVRHLELLDIDPGVGGDRNELPVTLRFVDAQALLETSFAHALCSKPCRFARGAWPGRASEWSAFSKTISSTSAPAPSQRA